MREKEDTGASCGPGSRPTDGTSLSGEFPPDGFDPSRVTCPGCGADFTKEWEAILPDETDLTFVMEVAEGQMIQAKTLGGIVTQFDNLQKAIGRQAGAKTTTLIKGLGMDEKGAISITFRICNVAQKRARDRDGGSAGDPERGSTAKQRQPGPERSEGIAQQEPSP